MPKAHIEIDSNIEDVMKTAANLEGEVPSSADDAARKIAEDWDRTGKMIMAKRGNIVTGTGIRNMRVRQLGIAEYGVMAPAYLSILDTGRSAGTYPDTNNPRFIAAARSYGMTRQQLAESIAKKGTQPYPWMDEATQRIKRLAPKRVKISMNKAIKDSKSIL